MSAVKPLAVKHLAVKHLAVKHLAVKHFAPSLQASQPARGFLVCLSVSLAGIAVAGAGQGDRLAGIVAEAGRLELRTGSVDLASLPNNLFSPADAFAGSNRFVIALDGPMTAARATALERIGIRLGDYLPENAFVADLSGVSAAEVRGLPFVVWVGPYRAEWKIAPEIGTLAPTSPERELLAKNGELAVLVYLFEGETVAAARADLEAIAGVQVVVEDAIGTQPLLVVTAPAEVVNLLAGVPAVQFVEEYPELTLRNGTNRWIVQSNVLNVTPLYTAGLHGEGQVLGHMDSKLAVNHCSFYDSPPIGPNHRKILAYNTSQGYNLHGTHTAGTAVGEPGDPNTYPNARGIAYLGKLVFHDMPSFTETQVFTRLDLHRTQGATVHTNSWGNDGTTAYDGMCRAIDDFSWRYDDQLVCFAVTNLSTLKNPENAKNCLGVGASQDTPNQGSHCSGGRGPTNDQRRKPEIYAPGCSTISSSGSSGCSTSALTGTSMACPAIAGTGLLVRQYFTDGFYPSGKPELNDAFVPSGALIKAALLNSAVDMTGISGYPSDQEGWGRVLADNALYFDGDTRKLFVQQARNGAPEALVTGEEKTWDVAVVGATEQLRVTAVWHDAPAAVNANPATVNNLDLIVTSPSGDTYRGNVFSNGVSVPGGNADPRNNVEQVHITNPESGTWKVKLGATAVNVGRQGWAIVASGELAESGCPQITRQPQSVIVAIGQPAVFQVVATGNPAPGYQWRKGGQNLADDPNHISGTTTDTLTVDPVRAGDGGTYDVVVTNDCGSATSDPAKLWILADMNCDNAVDFGDIEPFVVALGGEAGYQAQYPDCNWRSADCNVDGSVDFGDVNPFVELLGN